MLNLLKVIQPRKEADALSAHVNLYGFWTETAFLTKSGDLGMVFDVAGVDYESLDSEEQRYAVKRLESALKSFGEGFHVYQYLFKSNWPVIPFANYDDELIDTAIEQRRRFFQSKRDRLYQIDIFYVVVLEGARSKTGILSALGRMPHDPQGAIRELKAQFTNDNMKVLLRKQIDTDMVRLEQCVKNFTRHLADLMPVEVQGQQAQFSFFRRLLNFDTWRIAGKPQSTQYLDFQVVNSNIEAERDHLRVGDHFVRILTMKEAIAETRPLVLDRLFKIEGNFFVVTEWTPLSMAKARKEVDSRQLERQFNTALLERVVLSPPRVSAAVKQMHPEAADVFRDAYTVEFLGLPREHSEKDLHRALLNRMKDFLLELGRDFCFIGSEFPVQVGTRDFALDLLFFHRGLNCLVAFELKVQRFEPEHLGKLNFYLEALDRDVCKPHEQPSIGVLLCASKDDKVVEYALSRTLSPALIAEYQTVLPDKKLLQAKLQEFYLQDTRDAECE
jgi:predicted nuclease of restriction endonuclease-like (RecB) superfamily